MELWNYSINSWKLNISNDQTHTNHYKLLLVWLLKIASVSIIQIDNLLRSIHNI